MNTPSRFGFLCALGLTIVSAGQVDAGTVSHWRFDEGSGITAGDAVGNNDGTLFGPSWTTGVAGSALRFDGIDDFVEIPAAPSLQIAGNSLTVEAWVNFSARPSEGMLYVVDSRDNEWRGFGLNVNTDLVQFWVAGANGPNPIGYSATLEVNEWHYVVGVYDGSQARVYVDGVEIGSRSFSGAIPPSLGPLYIGRRWSPLVSYEYFNGMIDEVRISDHALSASDIQAHYKSMTVIVPTPLALYGGMGLLVSVGMHRLGRRYLSNAP